MNKVKLFLVKKNVQNAENVGVNLLIILTTIMLSISKRKPSLKFSFSKSKHKIIHDLHIAKTIINALLQNYIIIELDYYQQMAFLEPSQTPTVELFAKIVIG